MGKIFGSRSKKDNISNKGGITWETKEWVLNVYLCVPSSIVFAQTDKEMTQEADKGVPEVRFTGDVNGHEEFKFVPVARTTQEPTSKWSWSDGKYYVDGSSNYSTLYTNYYFTSVKGKKFSFSAGSSNKVKVDLVHKGTIVQTVVSSWTISAGGSKSHTITADDLGGYSNSDKFYFRFNSSPIGNRYSISGYFG